jgi:hypothetical protein
LPARGDDQLAASRTAARCCAAAFVDAYPKQPSEFSGVAAVHGHTLRSEAAHRRAALKKYDLHAVRFRL